jgi:hypothetical protein
MRCGVVDPDGSILEGGRDFGVGSNGYLNDAPPSVAIADGQGGAYVVANPTINPSGDDLYVVHVDPDGFATWTPPARLLGPAAADQTEPSMTADGSGGAYFTWTDKRDVTKGQDVYAQHLLANGGVAPGWPAQGKAIASFPGSQYRSRLIPDGTGGLWCGWVDGRSAEDDIYFSHLGPDGVPKAGFPAGGIPLSDAVGNQNQLDMISDGAGGFFATWVDVRSGTPELFGQHIHSTGVVMPGWQPNGSFVCAPPAEPRDPHLALTSTDHAIVTWMDDRNVSPQVFSLGLPEDGPIAGVVPTARAPLALAPVANPARNGVELRVSAPDEAPIRVALVDVTGRFDAPGTGLYFLRAEQRGVSASARVAVVK